jgi:hypothetical protein
MSQAENAARFAKEYRANPTPENARKLRLARWFCRHDPSVQRFAQLALTPYICLPFDHPDRKLTPEQYHVLGDWSCEMPKLR